MQRSRRRGMLRNPEVLDPDYLPPEIFCRDFQLRDLAAALEPAVRGAFPGHVLLLGPPSTGKTTVMRKVLAELSDEGVTAVYLNAPLLKTAYNIFAKVYEVVCEKVVSQKGVPVFRLVDEIGENLETPLILGLDDLNLLRPKTLNDLLRIATRYLPFSCSIVAAATEKYSLALLDPYVVFHYHEIFFPPYAKDELRQILQWRAERAFAPGFFSEEALERVVEIVFKVGDLRYGLFLLREAGAIACREGSRVRPEHVDAAENRSAPSIAKAVSVLGSDEKKVLEVVYSSGDRSNVSSIFRTVRSDVRIGYSRFREILAKLEKLGFVSVTPERGRKVVRLRFGKDDVLRSLHLNARCRH